MKKFKLLAAIMTMLFSMVALTGCFEKELEIETVKEPLSAVETFFLANVYDKPTGTDFNTEGDDFVADEDYYVKVATGIKKELTKIKINKVTYNKSDNLALEVGNTNKVTRKAYKVEEEDLYISAPLLYLNAGQDGVANISFPAGGYKAFDLDVLGSANNNLKITVTSPNNDVLTAVTGKNNTYKFASDTHTNSIFITLKNGTAVLGDSAVVLIQKIANPSLTNQSSAVSYMNPTIPSGQTEKGIELFPGYNGGIAYTATNPADYKLIYNIYVVGVGGQIIEIDFENTFQAS